MATELPVVLKMPLAFQISFVDNFFILVDKEVLFLSCALSTSPRRTRGSTLSLPSLSREEADT